MAKFDVADPVPASRRTSERAAHDSSAYVDEPVRRHASMSAVPGHCASTLLSAAPEEANELMWQGVHPITVACGTFACGPKGRYVLVVAVGVSEGVAPVDSEDVTVTLGEGGRVAVALDVAVGDAVAVLEGVGYVSAFVWYHTRSQPPSYRPMDAPQRYPELMNPPDVTTHILSAPLGEA